MGGQTGVVLIFGPAIRSTPFLSKNEVGGAFGARKGFIEDLAMDEPFGLFASRGKIGMPLHDLALETCLLRPSDITPLVRGDYLFLGEIDLGLK